MPEFFECRNCFHVGPLSTRGECESCGSGSVISQEVLSILPYGLRLYSDKKLIGMGDMCPRVGLA